MITRLGLIGIARALYGAFTGKTATVGGQSDVDSLTIKSVNDLSVISLSDNLTIKSVNDLEIRSVI